MLAACVIGKKVFKIDGTSSNDPFLIYIDIGPTSFDDVMGIIRKVVG